MMYVILSGCVTVVKTTKECGDKPVAVNTLIDGSQFGELSFIATLQNEGVSVPRSATCRTSEGTDLLEIPKNAYHDILKSQMETNIDEKLKFLKDLAFF